MFFSSSGGVEEEADGDDGIGREQLGAFEPVALAVLNDRIDNKDRNDNGGQLKSCENQVHVLTQKQAGKNQ